MGSIKGVPSSIIVSWTPTITFTTAAGTVTYTTRQGSIFYETAEFSPDGVFLGYLVNVTTNIVFTITGNTGNLTITGLPLVLTSQSPGSRQAALGACIGINIGTTAQAPPSTLVTYPATSPVTMQVQFINNTGVLAPVTNTMLSGTITVGVSHKMLTSTPPY